MAADDDLCAIDVGVTVNILTSVAVGVRLRACSQRSSSRFRTPHHPRIDRLILSAIGVHT